MPEDRGQEHLISTSYPITAAEIDAMFRNATSVPPWPDMDVCEAVATHLSQFLRQAPDPWSLSSWPGAGFKLTPAEIAYRVRFEQAVKTLRCLRANRYAFPGSNPSSWERAADTLEAALDEAEWLLCAAPKPPNSQPQTKRWAFLAISISFLAAGLFAEHGRSGGTSRNSVGVKFAALALERIGWRDEVGKPISTGAIAAYCAKARTAPAESQNPP